MSRDASIARSIRRMMYTMARNGGVYLELADFLRTFGNVTRLVPSYAFVANAFGDFESDDRNVKNTVRIVR